jgi:hypothetical protein
MEAERKLDPEAQPAPENGEFCSIDDIARFIGKERIDRKTLFSAAGRGELPGVRRIGRRYIVHRPTLLSWFTSAGQPVTPVITGHRDAAFPSEATSRANTLGEPA